MRSIPRRHDTVKLSIFILAVLAFGFALALIDEVQTANRRQTAERIAIENKATVTPTSGTVPVIDGRILNFWSMPIHQYDGSLAHCIAFEEQTTDKTYPLQVVCK